MTEQKNLIPTHLFAYHFEWNHQVRIKKTLLTKLCVAVRFPFQKIKNKRKKKEKRKPISVKVTVPIEYKFEILHFICASY
jgi:hypothetical protein